MSAPSALGSSLLWRTQRIGHDVPAEDWSLLPGYERARAAAIAHRAARTRFVVGRALLRRSITEVLPHLDARSHRILVAPSGRPHLDTDEYGYADVSLSHTDGLAVAAVSRAGPIGIDVEPVGRRDLPPVGRWLTPVEQRRLHALPASEHRATLLGLWVAKEAVLKACDHLGTFSRRTTEVWRHHDEAGRALGTATGPGATADLAWHHLPGGYLMAVVTHLRPHPPR